MERTTGTLDSSDEAVEVVEEDEDEEPGATAAGESCCSATLGD